MKRYTGPLRGNPGEAGSVIELATSVAIESPIETVFGYVSDPLRLPFWNSAVQVVRPTTPGPRRVGSTYTMERHLPGGRAINRLDVAVCEPPREFVIRTTSGPTPFVYRYSLSGEDGKTVVDFEGQVQLPAVAGLLPQLVRRAVERGVEDNLRTLKSILEGDVAEPAAAV